MIEVQHTYDAARVHASQLKGDFTPADPLWPWALPLRDVLELIVGRIGENTQQTGHPYHHLTAGGVIVNGDPTLEFFFEQLENSHRLYQEHAAFLRERCGAIIDTNTHMGRVAGAQSIDLKFYGRDMYAEFAAGIHGHPMLFEGGML